jgi:hypothetical protein
MQTIRVSSLGGVPKTSGFGTPILREIKHRGYWAFEPSFSEGFRNRHLANPPLAKRLDQQSAAMQRELWVPLAPATWQLAG